MNILITGGAGYIGSVAVRIFQEEGHTVTVLDNLKHGYKDSLSTNIRLIEADIRDFGRVINIRDNFDVVIHLAALISVQESVSDPDAYWDNNVTQTQEMLKAMHELGINKLIFASTAAVYGNPVEVPIPETASTTPTSPYGETKLEMDHAITKAAEENGLAAVSLRFFNVAGAYKGAGERHQPETHIIPIAFDAVTGKRDVFSLYGTDYATKDGTCVRDYIHVADLIYAMIAALPTLKQGTHEIYNLGNGNGFSNKEVLSAIERVTKMPVQYKEEARRPGDPDTLIASNIKASSQLGWQPRTPLIEEIVSDAWKFYKDNT